MLAIPFMYGCKKQVSTKIVGKWKVVSFDTKPLDFTWEFKDGDLIEWHYKDANDSVKAGFAHYYIESKNLKNYVKITNFESWQGFGSPNGKWWIEKVDSKVLLITRVEMPDLGSGPYWRYEMVKN